MKLIECIGKRIDNLLKERGLTQYELSEKGGIPRSTINVIIGAKRKTTQIDTIYQIADTLGISLKQFFDDNLFDNISDWLLCSWCCIYYHAQKYIGQAI